MLQDVIPAEPRCPDEAFWCAVGIHEDGRIVTISGCTDIPHEVTVEIFSRVDGAIRYETADVAYVERELRDEWEINLDRVNWILN